MDDENIESYLESYQHKFKNSNLLYSGEVDMDCFLNYKPSYIPLSSNTNNNKRFLQKIEIQQPSIHAPNNENFVRPRRKLISNRKELISVNIPTEQQNNPIQLINSPIKQDNSDNITPSTPTKSNTIQINPPHEPKAPAKPVLRRSSIKADLNPDEIKLNIAPPSNPPPKLVTTPQTRIKVVEPTITPPKTIDSPPHEIKISEPPNPPPIIEEPPKQIKMPAGPPPKIEINEKPWSPPRDSIVLLTDSSSKAPISLEVKDLGEEESYEEEINQDEGTKYVVDSTNIYSPVPVGSSSLFRIQLIEDNKKTQAFAYIDETTNMQIMTAFIETSISGIVIKYTLSNTPDKVIAKTTSNFSRLSFFTVSENREISAIEFKSLLTQNSTYRQFKVFLPANGFTFPAGDSSNLVKGDAHVKEYKPKPPIMKDGVQFLDFGSRVHASSVKNFILVEKENMKNPVLFFGKIHKSAFAGELRYPLSPLCAFSLCLPHL